jgi:AhpD family alkylhydroperoxidase
MEARMTNPAQVLPGSQEAIQQLIKSLYRANVPKETLELVHQRVSLINGCGPCISYGLKSAKDSGITDERFALVGAWRHAPCYSEAERAALELAELMTRLGDRSDEAVPDELWERVVKHYDEAQRAGLVMWIALTNFFNRINTALQVPAGASFD